ncbi:MAG: urease accessory protein UreF [Pseudomonadota bacterium]|uniref:urease accessory protein UreF n=1 Tax=Guyparkeria sp. TaxID=2035736 RepID=UPI0035637496
MDTIIITTPTEAAHPHDGRTDLRTARRRLWQLISPTLPVGAYSYSTGLEYAVEAGWVTDADVARDWISAQLLHLHARVDLPALTRLYAAWEADDVSVVEGWNDWLRASRETAELRAQDLSQGRALARLLTDLDVPRAAPWARRDDACWATLFALAAVEWQIPLDEVMDGYLWSWCENQVAAAVKLVPLGQTEGQRLLAHLSGCLSGATELAQDLEDEDLGGSLPGVTLASMLHETQYSRLFRS